MKTLSFLLAKLEILAGFIVVVLGGLHLLLSLWSEPGPNDWLPSEADYGAAAANAHIAIAGVPLVVPLIALREYGVGYDIDDPKRVRDARDAKRAAFREASSNADAPLRRDRTTLSMAIYGWTYESSRALEVCRTSERKWAIAMCDNPWSPLRKALPEKRFLLIDVPKNRRIW